MKKILKSIVVSTAIFVVLFGLTASVQAQPYAVLGQVFDTDGNPVDDVDVDVTCIETGELRSSTTAEGGWYSTNLGNPPYSPPVPGVDTLRIVATYGTLTNTTIVTATGSPQTVNLILREPVAPPTVEFIPPTPANESTSTTGYVNFTVNVTESVPGGLVDIVNISVRNETGIYLDNETMYGSGEHKYYYDAQLPDGDYTYKAYAKDIAGNTGVSETRVLTVNVTGYRFSIEFVTDYNMISMPVNDTSVINASSLATKIGADCTQITKWDAVAQQYVTYAPPNPLNNFDIAGGEGYFVKMTDSASVVFEGEGWKSPFTVSLVTDYNMISMPVNDTSVINASSLATKIGADCTQITKWDAVAQQYVTYAPPNPLNNFDTAGGEGYFVKMTDSASVVFEGKAWSN